MNTNSDSNHKEPNSTPGEKAPSKRTLSFTVTRDLSGQTIRDFLRNSLHFSRRQISSLKYREDGIRVSGCMQRVSYVLREGDLLEIVPRSAGSLYLDHGTFTEPPEILYEDPDLLIVSKPSGMVCHPSPGHYADSLANQAAAWRASKGENWTIRIVGRLDKDTSGAVIFAKNSETAALLSTKIPVEKTYYAIAEGRFERSSGTIDLPIANDPEVRGRMKISADGKPAETHYEVIETTEAEKILSPDNSASVYGTAAPETGPHPGVLSLLKVHITHGRTHQIRVHLAAAGHPLLGDAMYGHGEKERTRAMLHCREIRFMHPFREESIVITAPFPEDFTAVLADTPPVCP